MLWRHQKNSFELWVKQMLSDFKLVILMNLKSSARINKFINVEVLQCLPDTLKWMIEREKFRLEKSISVTFPTAVTCYCSHSRVPYVDWENCSSFPFHVGFLPSIDNIQIRGRNVRNENQKKFRGKCRTWKSRLIDFSFVGENYQG